MNKSRAINQSELLDTVDETLISLESILLLKRIELHIDLLKKMPGVIAAITLCFGIFSYQFVPLKPLLVWCIVTIALESIRYAYIQKIQQAHKLNEHQVITKLCILAILSAFSLLGCQLFLPYLPLHIQLLVALIAFSMPNLFLTAALMPVVIIYQIVLLIPLAYIWASIYPHQSITLLFMTLAYVIYTLSLFVDRDKLFQFSIAMHLSRHQILKELEQKTTEVLKSITKAEEASQARARVLAAASHDLRQPLQALSIYSAVLLSNPPAETLPEIADNIDRLVRVLGSLLHGLLDYSRLSNDYYVPERQRISLDRLVIEICQEFNQAAQDKQIQLSHSLTHVRLLDDKMGISRIIRNLIDNAIKYTDQGEVKVSTYYEESTAILEVSDTGKGIPQEEKMRIYEEFYQLNNPGRQLDKGIGLGLTIVQRLCELIGIQIQLDSEIGRGSQFKLTFYSVLQENMDKPLSQTFQMHDLIGKRIYIVDDEWDIIQSMRTLLENWQMMVKSAQSGSELLKHFQHSGIPDLLIIDLRLGEEQGAHLAKQLQEHYGAFPILVMTGETNSSLLQESNIHGFQIIHKPISSDLLLEAITVCLGLQ